MTMRKGFSLIELMVAIMVLTVALLGLAATSAVATQMINVKIKGALTARGHTKVGGTALMIGRDTLYPGWDCPAPAAGTGVPGLAIPDWTHVSLGGTCKNYLCVQGYPQAVIGPEMADTTTYFSYGDYQWNDLVAMATKVMGPGPHTGVGPRYASGACDIGNPRNWGEPHGGHGRSLQRHGAGSERGGGW